ncbi:hypothetical protein, partial [Sicyoidochytrium minutum DNA virus]
VSDRAGLRVFALANTKLKMDSDCESEIKWDKRYGKLVVFRAKVRHADSWGALGMPSGTWSWKSDLFTTGEGAILDSLRHWRELFENTINVDCNGCIDRVVAFDSKDKFSVPRRCSDPPCSERTQGGIEYAQKVMLGLLNDRHATIYGEYAMQPFFGYKHTYDQHFEFEVEDFEVRQEN